MILNVKNFKEVCKQILLAVEDSANDLELVTNNTDLYLNVTNREYFVSVRMQLSTPEQFRAVVSASLFLDLIDGITTDTIELVVNNNTLVVKAGKSNYKLPLIFENDSLMTLPKITIANETLRMNVNSDVLASILNVNSKEIQKVKNIDVQEIQKLYYIDETGCFTFSSGACLNRFSLEKPIKLLLNDRIVKLFRLFKSDVVLTRGEDPISEDKFQSKVSFTTDNIYVAAIINNDPALFIKVQGPCDATKRYIQQQYDARLVLSTANLNNAISRLLLFSKNSNIKTTNSVPATFNISNDEITITDGLENTETVQVENESFVNNSYSMILNLNDIKSVLDSCKETHLTMNCGDHKSVILTRGLVSNLVPEIIKRVN